jgi:hypothetical protein
MAKNQSVRVSPWSEDPAESVVPGDLRDSLPGNGVSPAVSLQHQLVAQFDSFDLFTDFAPPAQSRLYRAIESSAEIASRAAGPALLVAALGGIVYLFV